MSNFQTQLIDVQNETVCYDGLGCFSQEKPWISVLRPFPKPMDPKEMDVKLYLYTRKKPERYYVQLWPTISIEGSDFDPNRPYTAFITHGFSSSGNVTWVEDLKNEYLRNRDANVFLVDWGKGASQFNYLKVAANTRIVGAELKRFGEYLVKQKGQDPPRIHLMGHSLGAHISSYMAKGVPGVGRLTAFDPAQPGFEGCPDVVRLSRSDAAFVDVIHTNIRPVIPLLGFGLILATGHADFYLNGGLIQPGCIAPPLDEIKITSIADLAKYPVEVISTWVACSHGKSYLYFIEALKDNPCRFWGRKADAVTGVLSLVSVGRSESIVSKLSDCSLETCLPIGLDTPDYDARGEFAVLTKANDPYCRHDEKITNKMRSLRSLKLSGSTTQKSLFSIPVPDNGLIDVRTFGLFKQKNQSANNILSEVKKEKK